MTSLSHAEAVLGYETLEDPSLYYKVMTPDGSYLVIWTTMPFTVVTDEMVGVKPDADYAYVKVGRGDMGRRGGQEGRPREGAGPRASARRSRS